jgi:hypothetical protein
MVDEHNNFPHIIVSGQSMENITHYYIAVEKEIINVATDFTAIMTLDLFIKLHMTFDLKFEPSISAMITFCLYYFYKLRVFDDKPLNPTTRMRDIYAEILKQTGQ